MRRARDRLHHAFLFEFVGLCIIIPVGAVFFDVSIDQFGVVGVIGTTVAMIWNYIYNLSFDHIMNFVTGTIEKSFQTRLVHALLFEFGLVMLIVPFIAWYLDITLWQAFLMDIALACFYLVYALVFNLLYDAIFPAPESNTR